ncbi:MAG TPA: tetratricopeptide repeat protein [Cyanobacteria bacterium UBA12227]|nr:tetratricopeptide repeat protein [Cyanobacteria bacterium UBA12227]HAX88166.1 tetratricopeptide repeat protein [Cyanobacteria bacterium UBA11370]HBY80664.1 tetratricopeptide repeat protein [Cyanobacteria bacterium UBA11148]
MDIHAQASHGGKQYIAKEQHFHNYPPTPDAIVGVPQNLPYTGVTQFVGRDADLERLHDRMQRGTTVAVSAVSGMGGIGKTELALQYAYKHLQANTYPGGLCWINVRSQDVGLGLLEFARTQLGLPEPPDILETLLEKVQWVCRRWQGEPILVVLDDVTDYEAVEPYLNLLDPRFRVLMTTRLKLLTSVQRLELEVLTEAASLELLRVLVDDPHRIDGQLADAQRLCKWLGYLPLGLELVGRYLARREDLSLVEMLERLEAKKLAAQALVQAKQMTAQLGVAAAFQLTWDDEQFPDEAKMLCGLLSVFALAPIPWNLVRKCLPDWDKEDLEDCRVDHLSGRSLLSRVGKELFQLHQLLREFFTTKREQMIGADEMKKSFCQVMVTEAGTIPQVTPTLDQIQQVTPVIPHLAEAATNLTTWLTDTDLVMPFLGIARFYQAQGAYTQSLPWLQQGYVVAEARLGNNHPDVATTLNDLAHLHYMQGRYSEAEPLHKRALSIGEQQLGKEHPNVATSLNNLALLYQAQGRYAEAEPLCQRSLAIGEQQLGKDHPYVARSLNTLANLYVSQGRYAEAEPLLQRSLLIREQQLGKDHPDVATILNNLAGLYEIQERYAEAEPLLQRALVIGEQHLGNDHPLVATCLQNLAKIYREQRKGMANPFLEPENYSSEAEPLYQRALAILEQKLGDDHPNIAPILNNLADLYLAQRRYSEAELLHQRVLVILEQKLGSDHPDFALALNNLAGLYQEQGRYREAETLYEQSWSIFTNVLGEDHPLTQISWNNLWLLVQQAVKAGRVEELSDHPHIATHLINLAEAYRQRGYYSYSK